MNYIIKWIAFRDAKFRLTATGCLTSFSYLKRHAYWPVQHTKYHLKICLSSQLEGEEGVGKCVWEGAAVCAQKHLYPSWAFIEQKRLHGLKPHWNVLTTKSWKNLTNLEWWLSENFSDTCQRINLLNCFSFVTFCISWGFEFLLFTWCHVNFFKQYLQYPLTNTHWSVPVASHHSHYIRVNAVILWLFLRGLKKHLWRPLINQVMAA